MGELRNFGDRSEVFPEPSSVELGNARGAVAGGLGGTATSRNSAAVAMAVRRLAELGHEMPKDQVGFSGYRRFKEQLVGAAARIDTMNGRIPYGNRDDAEKANFIVHDVLIQRAARMALDMDSRDRADVSFDGRERLDKAWDASFAPVLGPKGSPMHETVTSLAPHARELAEGDFRGMGDGHWAKRVYEALDGAIRVPVSFDRPKPLEPGLGEALPREKQSLHVPDGSKAERVLGEAMTRLAERATAMALDANRHHPEHRGTTASKGPREDDSHLQAGMLRDARGAGR